MKKSVISFLVFISSVYISAQQIVVTPDGKRVALFENNTWAYSDSLLLTFKPSIITDLEIPSKLQDEEIIKHKGFTLSYNEKHEQANWVAYILTEEDTKPIVKRPNKFIPDPFVSTGSATNADYKNSGYDRGHLAPAADMAWSKETMKESFYYSNMSPQEPSFNRGIWKSLEGLVRKWAIENKTLFIVTGPILKEGLKTIGPNNVSVPNYYYKAILDYTEPDIKAIGFILPNKQSGERIFNYAVTIDSLEVFSGIDFFPNLPDDQEYIIECTIDIQKWSW